ncbi:metal tolerance protein 2 [Amaranthus tricolor]|uniref:metal tolerance protein 2 n=1 Tax=Amaranthus tricolor TaxID=29722 RepID=UPI00258DE6D8|nr:metal tolerance protein 2 [Amaranthus tricolor]
MGFRFFYSNHIYKPYISKFPSTIRKNPIITHQNPSTLKCLATQLGGINQSNCLIIKRWHLGHSHHDQNVHKGSSKKSENIFRLGLAADVGLAAGKAITGYLSGSTAIIADAAHSLSDVVLSSVALLSFKAARVPRDKEHPYGHGKFETLGALGISGMLLVTAGGIAWHAADILLGWFAAAPEVVSNSLTHAHGHHHGHDHKIDMEHPLLALNMTILSIAVKESLYWITKKAGEKEGSGLMKANAWHHRADAVSSLVALIGVGGSILGVKFLDPLAGLVVSGMILKAGLESGYQSILELVDAAVPQEQLKCYRKIILQVEGVKGCHRLRGRRAGSFLHLDVHIEVDPFASVSAAHHIGENVRHRIHESHPEVAEVFIHIDPSISPEVNMKNKLDSSDKDLNIVSLKDKDINHMISCIFSSQFPKKMKLEHITHHLLQNKIMLDIEVSMPPDIMIREAMLMAEEVKKEVLGTVSDVVQVSVKLQLSPATHTTSA